MTIIFSNMIYGPGGQWRRRESEVRGKEKRVSNRFHCLLLKSRKLEKTKIT